MGTDSNDVSLKPGSESSIVAMIINVYLLYDLKNLSQIRVYFVLYDTV